jgi:tetratricopeptide (TPR) repeat protein
LFYLHPSFGYFFEMFYPEPRGLVYELKPYATNLVMAPLFSAGILSHNLEFWKKLMGSDLKELETQVAPPVAAANPSLGESLVHKAHLRMAPHPDALLAAHFYSHALNFWGCELQRHDDFTNSAAAFDHAQQLNSENVASRVNLAYNRSYVKGQREPITLSKDVEEMFGRYRTWEQVLRNNGPYEEPGLCYSQGEAFQSGNNYRQAAQQFGRALDLFPGHAPAALALANLYVVNRMPDQALPLLNQIQELQSFANQPTNLPSLTMVESAAHLLKEDEQRATAVVESALLKAKDQPGTAALILEVAVNSFVRYNALTSAVPFVEKWLSLAPENGAALAYQGYLAVQLGQYDQAVPALTRALTVQTNDVEWTRTIRYNRALAQLRTGDYKAAREDYETLLKQNVTTPPVHYGLAEAALNQNDTNTAIRHFQAFLEAVPPDSEEAMEIHQRLRELRGQTE